MSEVSKLSQGDVKGIFFKDEVARFLEEKKLSTVDILEWGASDGENSKALLEVFDGIRLTALEILEDSEMYLNAIRSQFSRRFQFLISDSFTKLRPGVLFDVIFANPPQMPNPLHIDKAQFADIKINYGGESGLEVPCQIATDAFSRLNPGGYLLLSLFDFLGIDRRTCHRNGGDRSFFEILCSIGYSDVAIRSSRNFPVRKGGTTDKMFPQLISQFDGYDFTDNIISMSVIQARRPLVALSA